MSGKGNNYWKIFYNGIVPGNPVLVLLLGMCASLSDTSSARNLVPDKVHIPAYIVIIASFVTMLQLAVNAWMDRSPQAGQSIPSPCPSAIASIKALSSNPTRID